VNCDQASPIFANRQEFNSPTYTAAGSSHYKSDDEEDAERHYRGEGAAEADADRELSQTEIPFKRAV
jgi:hypothetical protein